MPSLPFPQSLHVLLLGCSSFKNCPCFSLFPHSTQNMLAPPLSIASISASVNAVRLNLFGSSLRSQNSPSFGCTLPSCLAVLPPIAP